MSAPARLGVAQRPDRPASPAPSAPAPPARGPPSAPSGRRRRGGSVLPAQSFRSAAKSGMSRRISLAERALARRGDAAVAQGVGVPPGAGGVDHHVRLFRPLPPRAVGEEDAEGVPAAFGGRDLLVLEEPLAADAEHAGAEPQVRRDLRQRRQRLEAAARRGRGRWGTRRRPGTSRPAASRWRRMRGETFISQGVNSRTCPQARTLPATRGRRLVER